MMKELEEQHRYYMKVKDLESVCDADTSCSFVAIPVNDCSNSYNLEFPNSQEVPRLFKDEYSGALFSSTISHVLQAEYLINRDFVLEGQAKLNQFYDYLGLSVRMDDDSIGWSAMYDTLWIDFDHSRARLRTGQEYYVIKFATEPS